MGPTLCSWKVGSALQEKALRKEEWITRERNNKIRSQTQLSLYRLFSFFPRAPVHSLQRGYQETMGHIFLSYSSTYFSLYDISSFHFFWLFFPDQSVPKTLKKTDKRESHSLFLTGCWANKCTYVFFEAESQLMCFKKNDCSERSQINSPDD